MAQANWRMLDTYIGFAFGTRRYEITNNSVKNEHDTLMYYAYSLYRTTVYLRRIEQEAHIIIYTVLLACHAVQLRYRVLQKNEQFISMFLDWNCYIMSLGGNLIPMQKFEPSQQNAKLSYLPCYPTKLRFAYRPYTTLNRDITTRCKNLLRRICPPHIYQTACPRFMQIG